jgi:hypothetical protein
MRRVRLDRKGRGAGTRGERAVTAPAIAVPLRQVRVEREAVPAIGERRPIGAAALPRERRAQLRTGRENETAGADGAGDRIEPARRVR